MKTTSVDLPGVLLIEPEIYRDNRGYFLESWNCRKYREVLGAETTFVQDNRSHSKRNILRGLHYQIPPMAQGKLVGVSSGRIYDVCVDLRRSSPTFSRSYACYLDSADARQIWIPPGFAHGFLVVSEEADVWYKTTELYSPAHERCIRWDDADLHISWPLEDSAPVVSSKDLLGCTFSSAEYFP